MLFSTLGAAFGASGSPSSSKSASPGLRKINKLNPDSLLWAPWFATVCPPRSHHEGKSSHRGGAGGDSQQGVFDNLQLRAITAELIKQTISLLRKNNVAQQLSGQTIVAFDGDQPANVGVQHHEFAWRSQGDCDKGISGFFGSQRFVISKSANRNPPGLRRLDLHIQSMMRHTRDPNVLGQAVSFCPPLPRSTPRCSRSTPNLRNPTGGLRTSMH